MKIRSTILFLIFLLSFGLKAEAQYKDFIVTEKLIWALTTKGELELFDKNNGAKIKNNKADSSEILLITMDKQGEAVIMDKNNTIKIYNEKKEEWKIISKLKGDVYGILFDSKNHCFALKQEGIEDVQTHKNYFTQKSQNQQIRYKNKWRKPYCFHIDQKDRIWMGFGYGEWGGDLFVFETNTKEFLTPELGKFQITLFPVKSFFEDSSSIYLSAGLQHMSTSGIIVRFDKLKASVLFESETKWSKSTDKDGNEEMLAGEYIGPATFNKFNHSIYFYSQNGIFKGDTTKDLSKIENWKLVLKPKLQWSNGQADAVGSPMNVTKMEIINPDKFIFLSENDGIGYFDGQKLTMLK